MCLEDEGAAFTSVSRSYLIICVECFVWPKTADENQHLLGVTAVEFSPWSREPRALLLLVYQISRLIKPVDLTASPFCSQQGEQPLLEKMKPSRSRNLDEIPSETDTLVRLSSCVFKWVSVCQRGRVNVVLGSLSVSLWGGFAAICAASETDWESRRNTKKWVPVSPFFDTDSLSVDCVCLFVCRS